MIDTPNRIPPHALDAERALLGCVLLEGVSVMPRLVTKVQPSDFYTESDRILYEAMLSLYEAGEPISLITISEKLRRSEQMQAVGGPAALAQLVEEAAIETHLMSYANIVRDMAIMREVIQVSSEAITEAFEAKEDAPAVISRAIVAMDALTARAMSDTVFDPAVNWRAIVKAWEKGRIRTGYRSLDEMNGGFGLGDFVIVGGRTAHGKSAMLCQLALMLAGQGIETEYITLEDSVDAIVRRMVGNLSGLSIRRLKDGTVTAEEFSEAEKAVKRLQSLPVVVTGVDHIRSIEENAVVGASAASKAIVVLVDHLQQITTRDDSRQYALERVLKRLQSIALRDEKVVILASQLNRETEKRQGPPLLSDLRDCFTGSNLVLNADTGERIRMDEIVARGLRFCVWALNQEMKLVKRPILGAWVAGWKPILEILTKTGRRIQVTPNHRLLSERGWREARAFTVGECIGVPRAYRTSSVGDMSERRAMLLGWLIGDGSFVGTPTLTVTTMEEVCLAIELGTEEFGLAPTFKPEGHGANAIKVSLTTGRMCGAKKNPLTRWLRELGVWRSAGVNKHVPAAVFAQSSNVTAAFLRGLFHADGSLTKGRGYIRLATISPTLAYDVQHLLLRLGLISHVSCVRHGNSRTGYKTKHSVAYLVSVHGYERAGAFMRCVGFLADKHRQAMACMRSTGMDCGTVDRLPRAAVEVIPEHFRHGSGATIGWRDQGKAPSRSTMEKVAQRINSRELSNWATSDILWDHVASVTPCEEELTYDVSVEEHENVCVADFIAHNSGGIEQAGRQIFLLYWPCKHDPLRGSEEYEVYLAKQSDGGTGMIPFRFEAWSGRFMDAGPHA